MSIQREQEIAMVIHHELSKTVKKTLMDLNKRNYEPEEVLRALFTTIIIFPHSFIAESMNACGKNQIPCFSANFPDLPKIIIRYAKIWEDLEKQYANLEQMTFLELLNSRFTHS